MALEQAQEPFHEIVGRGRTGGQCVASAQRLAIEGRQVMIAIGETFRIDAKRRQFGRAAAVAYESKVQPEIAPRKAAHPALRMLEQDSEQAGTPRPTRAVQRRRAECYFARRVAPAADRGV